MILRVIQMNADRAAYIVAVGELIKFKEITEPMICYQYNNSPKDVIIILGTEPAANLLKLEEIPEDVKLFRSTKGHNILGREGSRVITFSKGTLNLSIMTPKNTDIKTILTNHSLAVIKVCRKYGINAFQEGNDIKFHHNGYNRKFSGIIAHTYENGITYGIMISFDINIELMKKVYNFTHKKFANKETPEEMEKYIGCLHDINPDLDIYETVEEIYREFADLCEFEYTPSEFTDEELSIILRQQQLLDNDSWVYDGIYPE